MSADNWAICPKCKKGDDEETGRTLREDYEIGMDEGGCFEVVYSASCSTRHGGCGFHYGYRQTKNALQSEEEQP